MEVLENLIPLREFCRQNTWPRLPQWHHWIYNHASIAESCVKKIGGRYMIDVKALEHYIMSATLEELHSNNEHSTYSIR